MRSLHPLPQSGPIAIGAKLRETRLAQQITLSELGEATGLSVGALSRIERDQMSPSVATLVSICQVLSLPIGSLFDHVVADRIPLAQAPQINMGGESVDDRLVTPRSESRLQVLHSEMAPGAHGGTSLYTINCDVETIHVIDGSVTIQFTDRSVLVEAGDTLTFSGRAPHTWHNSGDTTARGLWILVPAAWSGSQ